jgi:hypothetical protein
MRLPEKEAEIETKKHGEEKTVLPLSLLEFPFSYLPADFL